MTNSSNAELHSMLHEHHKPRLNSIRPIVRTLVTVAALLCCSSSAFAQQHFSAADSAAIDRLVHEYMEEHSIPGLSFAMARNGKIVLDRAYGYADVESRTRLTPNHRMRIASVSKPITAIAIMRLVELGKLHLNELVFGPLGVLGGRYGEFPYGRLHRVTVDHLLTHTAGGWGNDRNDPMFQDHSWSRDELIRRTLHSHPLEHEPGTHYSYSNFGYALLGRIIEARTGVSYFDWVDRNILIPNGIRAMSIADNSRAAQKYMESTYYGNGWQYRINVSRMDAHGGWLAKPSDLVRLLVRVDQFSSVPDILSRQSLARMYTPTTANANYARGWSVNSVPNYWHTGALEGTLSIAVRTGDGFTWAAIVNSRPASDNGGGGLDRLMWAIRNTPSYWPDIDYF